MFLMPAANEEHRFVHPDVPPLTKQLQPSIFNLRVPLPERNEVFLMNTLTDAQLVVAPEVAGLLDRVVALDGRPTDLRRAFNSDEIDALQVLIGNGFLVRDRQADRRQLDQYFARVTSSTDELHITVLTTLQCNFACDYCYQGDRGDYNKFAEKMTMETAVRVGDWIERELERVRPERFTLMFFGGEPLLNLPVMYYLAERMWHAAEASGAAMNITIITNGLLLTPELVDRLQPFGLRGIKITLDGDRETHNRMRPLRGGQGTFDRIIENIRRVAGRVRIAIGGNFDESSVDSYPALLQFLAEQDFADQLVKVNFKPVIRTETPALKGVLSLTPVNADGKPLGGTCMTAAGSGKLGGSACDSCGFAEDQMSFLQRGNQAARVPDARRRAQRAVPRAHEARPYHRAGWLALRLPGFYRRPRSVDGTRRRPARQLPRRDARAIRSARPVEGMRRLRLHPGLCGRMSGGVAHAARRQEPADLPQAEFRIGSHFAGT